MKFDCRKLLPSNPTSFEGFRAIRIVTAIYLLVMVVRSCIHLFTADGGAQSIAGIDTSVEGGNNIIAIFHQWGGNTTYSCRATACLVFPLFRIDSIDFAHSSP